MTGTVADDDPIAMKVEEVGGGRRSQEVNPVRNAGRVPQIIRKWTSSNNGGIN